MGTPENPSPSFADVLRRFRIAAGLSQEALAERAGLSARAISDLERGARRTPYRETVRLLAGALGLNAGDRGALEAAVDRARGPRAAARSSIGGVAALPVPLSPLIGRDADVAAVQAEFRAGSARLVTLTGPPGIGKTRLALEVARELAGEYPDGVFFVGLAPLTDARAVGTSILQALGLAEAGERPASVRLKDVLREKRVLLVLDNVEHVVQAAPLIGELLETSPGLTVLATSRVTLRIRGEHEYPVPPLAVPGKSGGGAPGGAIDTGSGSAAVALFVERARAVRPGFHLTDENASAVAEICRRLDGLPLAIELAAARCKVLSPDAMLRRLAHGLDLLAGGSRDAPARHQTLRAAISWSHDLLAPEERVLFRRLGVFMGGCTLEAAERVGGSDLDTDALEVVSALVDQHLVQAVEGSWDEPRFAMLETLREFALEQLDAAGERDHIQRRHAEDVLNLALAAEPHMFGGERGQWLDRLNDEQDNIRAALGWAQRQEEPALGLALLGALWLWFQRRLLVEGRRWADELLAHPGAAGLTAARAKALFVAGHFAWLQGDVLAMRARLEEAIAIQRRLDDIAGLRRSLPFFGLVADDHATARRLAGEGVRLCRQASDRWDLAMALLNLGRTEATWGNDAAARTSLEEAAEHFGALGDRWLRALALTSTGAIAYRAGRYDHAEIAFREALDCFQAIEDRRNTTQALTNLGFALLASGDAGQAHGLFARSLAFGQEHGDRFNAPACLRGVAAVVMASGDAATAIRLSAAADQLVATTGAVRWPAERLGGAVSLDDLRAVSGQEAFAAAWAAGAALPADEAIRMALAGPRTSR